MDNFLALTGFAAAVLFAVYWLVSSDDDRVPSGMRSRGGDGATLSDGSGTTVVLC